MIVIPLKRQITIRRTIDNINKMQDNITKYQELLNKQKAYLSIVLMWEEAGGEGKVKEAGLFYPQKTVHIRQVSQKFKITGENGDTKIFNLREVYKEVLDIYNSKSRSHNLLRISLKSKECINEENYLHLNLSKYQRVSRDREKERRKDQHFR